MKIYLTNKNSKQNTTMLRYCQKDCLLASFQTFMATLAFARKQKVKGIFVLDDFLTINNAWLNGSLHPGFDRINYNNRVSRGKEIAFFFFFIINLVCGYCGDHCLFMFSIRKQVLLLREKCPKFIFLVSKKNAPNA